MSIVGISKVRNEMEIIEDTVEHFLGICDRLVIYDDCSSDGTPDFLEKFDRVDVIRGDSLDRDRLRAEYVNRQRALEGAQEYSPEWILCFDADERVEMPETPLDDFDGVKMKLFDFYITPEDVDLRYTERRWLGPEYRSILMMFRNLPGLKYGYRDQREMFLPAGARILQDGYVRHYGKAVSVEEWESTCDYYSGWPEPYRSKWMARKGKAVHTKSDFGADLITWDEKEEKGYPLGVR